MAEFIAYLDIHSGSLTFLITFVYVVATIFICWANISAAKASKAQLLEIRRQYQETNRPRIEVEFLFEHRLFYGFRFVNHGNETANHVRINLDEKFIESLQEPNIANWLLKQKGKECVIGAGQHYDLFFGTSDYLNNETKVPAQGIVHYSGAIQEYSSEFYIDLENYATIFSVNSDEEVLIEALKGCRKEITKVNEALVAMGNANGKTIHPTQTSLHEYLNGGICTINKEVADKEQNNV